MNIKKSHYFNNLRFFGVMLVVVIHCCVTYSSNGLWFYQEYLPHTHFSFLFFLFLQSALQSFVVPLLLFVSGYFVHSSLIRYGPKTFLIRRSKQLLLPVLGFSLILNPLCQLHTSGYNLQVYVKGLTTFDFLNWNGPLWFNIALFLFTCLYTLWHLSFGKLFKIKTINLPLLVLGVSITNFLIRLVFPVGYTFLNMQIPFFPTSFFAFCLGIAASKTKFLEHLQIKTSFALLGISLVGYFISATGSFLFGSTGSGISRNFELSLGGMNLGAFSYALFDGFGLLIVCSIVGIFKHFFNKDGPFLQFLSKNSFGVYVFHAPILVGLGLLLQNFNLPILLKFSLLLFSGLLLSFLFSKVFRSVISMRAPKVKALNK